jgi:hypothetical protein
MTVGTYARILGGVVMSIEVIDVPEGVTLGVDIFAGLTFVPCANPSVQVGWTYSGGTFTAPVVTPPTAAELIAYAAAVQRGIAAGGISVNVGSSGSPQDVEASTDVASLVLLQGAVAIAAASPSTTFQWVPPSGAPVTLTAAQINTIFAAVSAFIQSTFVTLAAVINAINAGSITTQAEIATPPSSIGAWPVNS